MNFRNLNALEVAKKIKDRELSAVGVTKEIGRAHV